ncbi:MAG: sugar ABC transporter permease [Chloroflexota bacterium]
MTTLSTNTPPKTKPSPDKIREWILGYAFAAPFIIGFLVFVAYPFGYLIWLSFQEWDLITQPEFVGFDNFVRLFSDSPAGQRNIKSLYNSAFYTFIAVPLQLMISFTLAVALTQKIRFRDLYRAGFYMPLIVPLVAWAVVWQRVLHPEFGLLNDVIRRVIEIFTGAPSDWKAAWLFETELAKPAFIFMSLWMIGRQMVIFIAGLGNIPDSIMDAAKVDGAGPWRRMFGIIIPMMTPFIFLNMIFAIVNSFQTFIPAQVMTEGGPSDSTLFIVLNIWREGFQFFNMGYASAIALELFFIVIGLTAAQFYISRRWVYYEE